MAFSRPFKMQTLGAIPQKLSRRRETMLTEYARRSCSLKCKYSPFEANSFAFLYSLDLQPVSNNATASTKKTERNRFIVTPLRQRAYKRRVLRQDFVNIPNCDSLFDVFNRDDNIFCTATTAKANRNRVGISHAINDWLQMRCGGLDGTH